MQSIEFTIIGSRKTFGGSTPPSSTLRYCRNTQKKYSMSIIRKPSELVVKPALAILIYGQPGIGKTTLACSAPDPVLFDCDGGVQRINGGHQVPTLQVEKWEDINQALTEIEAGKEFKTIVIDTCSKLLAYMEANIKANDKKQVYSNRDGSLSLKGYGARKQMFNDFINRVRLTGRSLVFVAHEQEQKRGEETVLRPEVGGSSVNDLIKELDLVGYMEASGDGQAMVRTISFNPSNRFYAKNTANLPAVISLPITVGDDGNPKGNNDFLTKVIAEFFRRRQEDHNKVSDFEDLMNVIDGKIEGVTDAESANEVMFDLIQMKHIYNSKELASQRLSNKAKELGLVYNKTRQAYEQPKA